MESGRSSRQPWSGVALQRSHRSRSVESRRATERFRTRGWGFNGATDRDRWRVTRLIGEVGCQVSFNGATDRDRWRGHSMMATSPRSTGLQRSHRSRSVERSARDRPRPHRSRRFNGATDRDRWRVRTRVPVPLAVVASTEPPIEIGGESQWQRAGTPLAPCFNGATDRDRWRGLDSVRETRRHDRFNGATDRDRWRPPPAPRLV